MEALHDAAQAATDKIASLEEALSRAKAEIQVWTKDYSVAQGQIDELNSQLAMEKQKADYHLRWATQVTSQIYSIGMFANEAMRLARSEIAAGTPVPASKTNGEVIAAMEKELSTTVADLKKDIPSFLKSGPKHHE